MGLACAPFIFFTKMLVPLFSQLRSEERSCFCYLDDVFVTDKSEAGCVETTKMIMDRLRLLGFKIHAEKSQILPKIEVKFLGFMINSKEMQAFLPGDKVQKVIEKCTHFLNKGGGSIQELSSVVGLLNSYAKAVDYGDNQGWK